MMFSKKHKKKVGIAWGIISVVLILLMIFSIVPSLFM